MGITMYTSFDSFSQQKSEGPMKTPCCIEGNGTQCCQTQSIPGSDWNMPEFLNFGAIDIWCWIIFVVELSWALWDG